MDGIEFPAYLKTADDPTFWAYDGNGRFPIHSPEELRAVGLMRIAIISPEALAAVPVIDRPDPLRPLAPTRIDGMNQPDGAETGEKEAGDVETAVSGQSVTKRRKAAPAAKKKTSGADPEAGES